jgi:hypothetical protein
MPRSCLRAVVPPNTLIRGGSVNKLIAVLALMVIVLPITVHLLLSGPDNLLSVCTRFFGDLLENVTRFGTG